MTRLTGPNAQRLRQVETGSHSPYVLTDGTTPQTIEEHMADTLLHLPSQDIVIPTYGNVVVSDGPGTFRWTQRAAFIPVFTPTAAVVWAAQPAAETEFMGLTIHRLKVNLVNYAEIRIAGVVTVAGAAGAELRAQYSLDAAAWSSLGASNTPTLAIDGTGALASGWVEFDAAARADVFVRLVGIDGDGVTSPAFGAVSLQVR